MFMTCTGPGDTCPRLYRGRRQAPAPGLVIVSAANDIAGARRQLLDPGFHVWQRANAFEWASVDAAAAQLAIAILVDHFRHNPGDVERARGIALAREAGGSLPGFVARSCPSATDGAAGWLHDNFCHKVIARIPRWSVWTLTTAHVRAYLEALEGTREHVPPAHGLAVAPGGPRFGLDELAAVG